MSRGRISGARLFLPQSSGATPIFGQTLNVVERFSGTASFLQTGAPIVGYTGGGLLYEIIAKWHDVAVLGVTSSANFGTIRDPIGINVDHFFRHEAADPTDQKRLRQTPAGTLSLTVTFQPSPNNQEWPDIGYNRYSVGLSDSILNPFTQQLYVNGVSVGTQAHAAIGLSQWLPDTIQGIGSSGRNMSVLDVRLWNGNIDPAQVAALWNVRLTGTEPNLIAYWPMDDGAGQAIDIVGGVPFNLMNNAAWASDLVESALP